MILLQFGKAWLVRFGTHYFGTVCQSLIFKLISYEAMTYCLGQYRRSGPERVPVDRHDNCKKKSDEIGCLETV